MKIFFINNLCKLLTIEIYKKYNDRANVDVKSDNAKISHRLKYMLTCLSSLWQ